MRVEGEFFASETKLHGSGRQPNCSVEQTAPPVVVRATISLGIGPHSSYSFIRGSVRVTVQDYG